MRTRTSKKKFKAICACGHDHVQIIGDGGRYHDEERYQLLTSCCYCNCEKFEVKK